MIANPTTSQILEQQSCRISEADSSVIRVSTFGLPRWGFLKYPPYYTSIGIMYLFKTFIPVSGTSIRFKVELCIVWYNACINQFWVILEYFEIKNKQVYTQVDNWQISIPNFKNAQNGYKPSIDIGIRMVFPQVIPNQYVFQYQYYILRFTPYTLIKQ